MEKQFKEAILQLIIKGLKEDNDEMKLSIHELNLSSESGKMNIRCNIEGSIDADTLGKILFTIN